MNICANYTPADSQLIIQRYRDMTTQVLPQMVWSREDMDHTEKQAGSDELSCHFTIHHFFLGHLKQRGMLI